jgi:hypothetical protein
MTKETIKLENGSTVEFVGGNPFASANEMTTMEERLSKFYKTSDGYICRTVDDKAKVVRIEEFKDIIRTECARAVEEAVVAERSRCIECAPKSTGYLFTAKSTYENAVADFIKAIKGE